MSALNLQLDNFANNYDQFITIYEKDEKEGKQWLKKYWMHVDGTISDKPTSVWQRFLASFCLTKNWYRRSHHIDLSENLFRLNPLLDSSPKVDFSIGDGWKIGNEKERKNYCNKSLSQIETIEKIQKCVYMYLAFASSTFEKKKNATDIPNMKKAMDTLKQSLDHFAKVKEYVEDYAEHPEKYHTQYPSKYINATEEQGQLINELGSELSHALSKSHSYDKEYPLGSLAYKEKLKRLTS